MSYGEPQIHDIEPELQERTPRPARYTTSTQAVRLFLFLLLIGGVGLILWLASRDQADLTALLAHGATTSATVTEMYVHSGKSTTYEIDYMFMAEGVLVNSDEDVSSSVYHVTNIGDSLPVTYLPSHPETHRVGRVDAARVTGDRTAWMLGTLGTLLVLGLIAFCAENFYRSHRLLLAHGVPVLGEVTNRNIVRGKNTYYYVSYQFPGPAGTQTNKVSVSPAFYNASDPGEPLTILYNPSRPNDNRPYRTLTDVTLS